MSIDDNNFLAVIDSEGKYDLSIERLISVPIEGEYLVKGIPKEAIIYTDGININNERFTKPIIISCRGCEIEVIAKNHNNFTCLYYYHDLESSNNHGNFTFLFSNTAERGTLPKNSTIIIRGVFGVALRGTAQIEIFGDSKVYTNQNPSIYRCFHNITVRTGDHRVDLISLGPVYYFYQYKKINVIIGTEISYQYDGLIDSFFSSFDGDLNFDETSIGRSNSLTAANYNQEVYIPTSGTPHKRIIYGYLSQSKLQLGAPRYQMLAELENNDHFKELQKIDLPKATYSITNSMIRRRLREGESFELMALDQRQLIHIHNTDGYEVTGVQTVDDITYKHSALNPRIIQMKYGTCKLTFKAHKNIDLILSIYDQSKYHIKITNEENRTLMAPPNGAIIFSAPGKSVMTLEAPSKDVYYTNEIGEKRITSQNKTFESYMHMITSSTGGFAGRIVSYEKEWEAEPFTEELNGCSGLCFDGIEAKEYHDNWALRVIGGIGGIVFIALTAVFVNKCRKKRREQLVDVSSLIGDGNDFSVWTEQTYDSNEH